MRTAIDVTEHMPAPAHDKEEKGGRTAILRAFEKLKRLGPTVGNVIETAYDVLNHRVL
jgi:hypothetical protein